MSRAPTNTSNNMIIASVQRKVLKPFALSNGQVVPAGVIIECANKAICDDPAIYDRPEIFDALRFYKMRKTKDTMSENKKSNFMLGASESQFVSTGPLSLWWGYGKHACPGRFFASSMIKMVTAKTLMQYELGLPDGVTKRYENIVYGDIVSSILFMPPDVPCYAAPDLNANTARKDHARRGKDYCTQEKIRWWILDSPGNVDICSTTDG